MTRGVRNGDRRALRETDQRRPLHGRCIEHRGQIGDEPRKAELTPGKPRALEAAEGKLETTMGLCGVNTIAEIDDKVIAV